MSFNTTSLHREEYLKKKRKQKLVRFVWFAVIFIFFLSLVSYLSHRPSMRVARLELSGGVLVREEEVAKAARAFLSGSYVWLFPKNNIIWYPRVKLEKYLEEEFKRIDTIDIYLKDVNTLVVDITERKPLALWCEASPDDCYFLDSNGTIFAKAPYFSGDAYFRYYGLLEKEDVLGKQYLASTTEFISISTFIQSTRLLGFKPVSLSAKGGDEFVLHLSNGNILFDTKETLTIASQNLIALLRTPALSGKSPAALPIEYIDLRFGNKLFYKLK